MPAWKNISCGNDTKYKISVCCRKLAKDDYIIKEDDHWHCWSSDGELLFNDMKNCPFCGEILP